MRGGYLADVEVALCGSVGVQPAHGGALLAVVVADQDEGVEHAEQHHLGQWVGGWGAGGAGAGCA
jgi:hypothetical protein